MGRNIPFPAAGRGALACCAGGFAAAADAAVASSARRGRGLILLLRCHEVSMSMSWSRCVCGRWRSKVAAALHVRRLERRGGLPVFLVCVCALEKKGGEWERSRSKSGQAKATFPGQRRTALLQDQACKRTSQGMFPLPLAPRQSEVPLAQSGLLTPSHFPLPRTAHHTSLFGQRGS